MVGHRRIKLAFGRDGVELSFSSAAVVLKAAHAPPLAEAPAAVREALARPIGSAALAELLANRKPRSVAITISDITRPVPNKVILPALLEAINAAGVADSQVTIIVGTGMHRPSTAEEKIELVGADILARCKIVDHRGDDPATLVKISDHPPVSVNADFVHADFRIVTGLIEPHFMAGYSGGRKGVCPALVDFATVQRFHGHPILADARADSGVLAGNPCHAESLRVARLVGVDFLVNVAIDGQRRIVGVYAGDMEQAHQRGVADVERSTSARVERPCDLIVTCGGGYPLDQTFYQTVKGMVAALPACHDGSTILILSDCREGIGSKSYADMMLAFSDRWHEFLPHIATAAVKKDQWQAQMHCRVLERIGQDRLWLASDGLPMEMQAKLWVHPVAGTGSASRRAQQAIDGYLAKHPGASVAVIPEGPYTMLRAD